jgi:hypothetical protein
MTSLLTHTVAHSSRLSFRPKTNNQPIKEFLNLAVSSVTVVKNWTSFGSGLKIEVFEKYQYQKMYF